MSKYQWQDGMREISGFGGDYEEACRDMVRAGCEWFDEYPDANPQFSGVKNVYGICMEDNDDAKALSNAVENAPVVQKGGGPSGAMHQAAVSHVLFIRKNGWDKYVEEMSKKS